ncbi:MAG: DNA repair protein RecN [Clostridiaceae bacterium]|jgi:DNA repair protein RecN (Recombination protein N)|nr:DNA repair protein RecN [Clostridiaceae bacterium]
MLRTLSIKNIALIDDAEVNLYGGLNIMSGETGAGKSIIIDSLNFVLGERADKSLIRHGQNSASVEGVFDEYETPKILAYLEDAGIAADDILILKRTMTHDGKNECRINGRLTTLGTLKGLTSLLADIHGQHEHQALLDPETHIGLLDGFGHSAVAPLKELVASEYARYAEIKRELKNIGDSAARERKLDILGFQIGEIKDAAIKDGEEEELLAERKRFLNIGQIAESVNKAAEYLNGDMNGNALSSVKGAAAALSSVSDFDAGLAEYADRLEVVRAEIKDIYSDVRAIAGTLDFDENKAEKTEQRLTAIRNITKKYGGGYAAMSAFLEKAEKEFDMLSNAAEHVAELERSLAAQGSKLTSALTKLTAARTAEAAKFEAKITKELLDLGMKNTEFKVFFKGIHKDGILDAATENGVDFIEFLISPNLGEPLKPLAKIISGGEMSRFMLALKNITAELDGIATVVFDEIDTGISGKIAEVVAEKLYNIARERQVVAVTHLPQLASMSDYHFLIAKDTDGGKTYTKLTVLDEAASIAEIARLVGGKEHSPFALEHAREMRKYALSLRKK